MHVRGVGLLLVYMVAVLLAVTYAKDYTTTNKRTQGPAFQTMMRYGRYYGNKQTKKVQSRANQFLFGPRYGKRSSWSPTASLVYPVTSTILCGEDEELSCSYTGLSDLYRCNARKDTSNDTA